MTNFEKIKSLSVEEFAGWIDTTLPFGGDEPWNKWFDEEYCKKCETIKAFPNVFYNPYSPYSPKEIDCSFCELNGYCRFFPYGGAAIETRDIIEMWLNREVEE